MDYDPDLYYFQTVIGILRWMIMLGRIQVITEVLLLLSCIALPREGHLDAAVHVMAYVSHKYQILLYDVYG